ncbi:hypothetical protein BW41_00540 [Sphingomonas sp. RIT328]|nr:hypothetical protein BW41_00540 [Sphingomonas sp. RIT328]
MLRLLEASTSSRATLTVVVCVNERPLTGCGRRKAAFPLSTNCERSSPLSSLLNERQLTPVGRPKAASPQSTTGGREGPLPSRLNGRQLTGIGRPKAAVPVSTTDRRLRPVPGHMNEWQLSLGASRKRPVRNPPLRIRSRLFVDHRQCQPAARKLAPSGLEQYKSGRGDTLPDHRPKGSGIHDRAGVFVAGGGKPLHRHRQPSSSSRAAGLPITATPIRRPSPSKTPMQPHPADRYAVKAVMIADNLALRCASPAKLSAHFKPPAAAALEQPFVLGGILGGIPPVG